MPTLSSITLSVGSKTMIQAKATKTDWRNSNIASKTITVYSGTVATPVITDGHDGTFTITCGTSGATIIYTTNNTAPSRTNGTEYTGAVTVDYGTTVRAFAYKQYYLDSAEATPVTTEEVSWSDPSDIANVFAWYDANAATDITVDGSDNITAWVDAIGGAKTLTPAGNEPSYNSTDKVAVFVAANSEWLKLDDDGLSEASTLTLAIVVKHTDFSLATNQEYAGYTISGGPDLQIYSTAFGQGQGIHGGTNLLNSTTTGNATDPTKLTSDYKLLIFTYVPGGTSSVLLCKCASDGTDISYSGNAGSNAIGTNQFSIGNVVNTSNYLNASVKAIIFVKGAITGDDLTNLRSYCATNYGADC